MVKRLVRHCGSKTVSEVVKPRQGETVHQTTDEDGERQ